MGIWDKPKTVYAVAFLGKDLGSKVMPFEPGSPMYEEVVASGIGFMTEKYCKQYHEACIIAEKQARKEEQEFLIQQAKENEEEKEDKEDKKEE